MKEVSHKRCNLKPGICQSEAALQFNRSPLDGKHSLSISQIAPRSKIAAFSNLVFA